MRIRRKPRNMLSNNITLVLVRRRAACDYDFGHGRACFFFNILVVTHAHCGMDLLALSYL